MKKVGALSTSVLLFLGSLACVCLYARQANRFGRAAPNEETAEALDLRMTYNVWYGLRFNYYSCSYTFRVGSDTYSGLGDCPGQGVPKMEELRRGAIVYYDPAHPSVNSLIELGVMSERDRKYAIPWIGLAVVIISFSMLAKVLAANEKRGKGGVVVDASGTVIYPEEIGVSPGLVGLPPRDRNAENPSVAANGEALNFRTFASSSELRELYLGVANQIHPDRAANERDLALRERLMKDANAAFERGDADTLRRVLEEYRSVTPAS